MNRIMVIGCGGAGKSTFSRQLHRRTGIPLIHLDQHYWKEGWVESEKEEWTERVAELVSGDNWIMDGNYGGTFDIRMSRATVIVFLDRSSWLCLYRVFRRVFDNYGRSRADMASGCPERFSLSFLHYVASYNFVRRPGVLKRLAECPPSVQTFVLTKESEVQSFLRTFVPLG
ncbi:MAG: hypothetical protein AAFV95_20635 [Bacteroidota bacterium]